MCLYTYHRILTRRRIETRHVAEVLDGALRGWRRRLMPQVPETYRLVVTKVPCCGSLRDRRLGIDPVPSRLIWHKMRKHARQAAGNRRSSPAAATDWCALCGCWYGHRTQLLKHLYPIENQVP
jgi:hypothetical protein